jgi:hypothetical protein
VQSEPLPPVLVVRNECSNRVPERVVVLTVDGVRQLMSEYMILNPDGSEHEPPIKPDRVVLKLSPPAVDLADAGDLIDVVPVS